MGKLVAYRPVPDGASDLSDVALVAACATGDNAAFAALYRRHQPAVDRFLARLAGVDARDLDDLVQVTFLAVHRASSSFLQGSSVKTWIFGIAANVVGKHVRTEVRRRAMRTRVREIPPDAMHAPDALAERRQLLQRLDDALDALPHELRVVFVMCVVEGIPGKEAARSLGIREGTVWRRLHDARKELRATMEGTS